MKLVLEDAVRRVVEVISSIPPRERKDLWLAALRLAAQSDPPSPVEIRYPDEVVERMARERAAAVAAPVELGRCSGCGHSLHDPEKCESIWCATRCACKGPRTA